MIMNFKHKILGFLMLLTCSTLVFGQSIKKQKKEILKFQKELNEGYLSKEDTPLRGENYANFKAHPFFPIDLKYRVVADFVRTPNAVPFDMNTSSGKTRPYVEYGKATFTLNGKKHTVTLYQNLTLIKKPEYADHLFLPFKDETAGTETYGGGKYLDLTIPKGNMMVIDFNQSYHPYCAYNAYDYSCPIVPQENWISTRIEAGVKYDDVYFH